MKHTSPFKQDDCRNIDLKNRNMDRKRSYLYYGFRNLLFACILCLGIICIIGTEGDEIVDEEDTSTAAQSVVPGTNTLPTATIISPEDSTIINEGDRITFSGSGVDTEDGTLSGGALEWDSSIDSQLGIGTSLRNIRLSKGTHRITLTVTDSDGASHSENITLTVNPVNNSIPEAAISFPAEGSTFDKGNPITFIGSGYDMEDGELTGNDLIWSSNLYGQIGLGNTVHSVNLLPIGTHVITLVAVDSENTAGADQISITIQNTPPEALIIKPVDGDSFAVGAGIYFQGVGSDLNDGTLDNYSLAWVSDIDGKFQTGSAFTYGNLSAGTHTITLIATDSDGASGSDTITVTIGTVTVDTTVSP